MSKQIDIVQEKINHIANDLNGHCCDLAEMHCGEVSCNACLTEYLFHAGYRRQSDVAREIFAEIEKLVYSKCFSIRADRDVTGLIIDGELLTELKKKYGVTEE